MVDLILEQNPRNLIRQQLGRLDLVPALHEKVHRERTCLNRQHQVAAGLHVAVTDGGSPHLDGVGGE